MSQEIADKRFGIAALVLQAIFVVLFGVLAKYGDDADAAVWGNATGDLKLNQIDAKNSLNGVYPMFQDVHVMIFIGFGFLMTFLKWYGFSSVGLNMLISALVMQWSLIVNGLFHLENGKFSIDIYSLLSADFACAAVLISFGALLGRISPLQCLVLSLIEIPIFVANEYVGLNKFMAVDMGGSMFVHIFGAYFGIAAAKTLAAKRDKRNENDCSNYYNDYFAMIGTIFLWLYWPSFNAALAEGDDRQRAVINTYLSLTASTVVAFAVSSLVEAGKFEMTHVQNATLAGGVAVGTAADMMIRPWGAALIGCVAGLVSVLGYRFLTPKLKSNNFLDTCGVNNLHGMPGIIAALFGIVYSGVAGFEEYGNSLYQIFPARAPVTATPDEAFTFTVKDGIRSVSNGKERSAGMQAVFQAAACSMTLLCAVIGGLLTGFVLRLSVFDRLPSEHFYLDGVNWNVPADIAEKTVDLQMKSTKKEEAGERAVLKVGDPEDDEETTSPV